MTVHQEEECSVTRAIATGRPGGFQQLLHLARGQVFPRSNILVRPAPRRGDFPVYGVWSASAAFRQFKDLAHGGPLYSPIKEHFRESVTTALRVFKEIRS